MKHFAERVTATIDIDALKHNYKQVQSFAPGCKLLAMIKSDGYGHGHLRVAQSIHNADAFGVHCLDEAMELCESGIKQPLVLMAGFSRTEELANIVSQRFQVVVHHPEQVLMLEKARLAMPIRVWLKVDTGMHRLGIAAEDFMDCYQRLGACPQIMKPMIVMTHFACADEKVNPMTDQQINRFIQIVKGLHNPHSLANSAGILGWSAAHGQWVRPGIILYGISPFAGQTGNELGLQPAMKLTSRVIAINSIQRGDCIGYGSTYICPRDMRIAVVAIGYGDGYPRHARNGTPVLIHGQRCPLAGRVSMDMITVDVTHLRDVHLGDEAVLWGPELPIEILARNSGTIAYEIICKLTQRVKYVERIEPIIN